MIWNYRFAQENNAEYHILCEVFFDEKTQKPFGYSVADVGGETLDDARKQYDMMMEAFTLPTLRAEEIGEESDSTT